MRLKLKSKHLLPQCLGMCITRCAISEKKKMCYFNRDTVLLTIGQLGGKNMN